jgi:hypothetical protein
MHPENHWTHYGPIWIKDPAKHTAATHAMRQVLLELSRKEQSAREELSTKDKVLVIHDDLHLTKENRQKLLLGERVGDVERGISSDVNAFDGHRNGVEVLQSLSVPENVMKVSVCFELSAAARSEMQNRRVANGGHAVPDPVMEILASIYNGNGTEENPENRPELEEGFSHLETDGRAFTDRIAQAIGFASTTLMLDVFEAAKVPFDRVDDKRLEGFIAHKLENNESEEHSIDVVDEIKDFFKEDIQAYQQEINQHVPTVSENDNVTNNIWAMAAKIGKKVGLSCQFVESIGHTAADYLRGTNSYNRPNNIKMRDANIR